MAMAMSQIDALQKVRAKVGKVLGILAM